MRELIEKRLMESAGPDKISPEVAIDRDDDAVFMSVLVGSRLGVYRKSPNSDDTYREAQKLKSKIEAMSSSDEDKLDHDTDRLVMNSPEWSFEVDFDKRNRELSKKQREYKKSSGKIKAKEDAKKLRKWLNGNVVRFIEDTYESYRKGHLHKEPAITATFVREMMAEPTDLRDAIRNMGKRKYAAMISGVLEALRKKGKIDSSLGAGAGGRREVRNYEPKGYGL